jgi:hypothetical protein
MSPKDVEITLEQIRTITPNEWEGVLEHLDSKDIQIIDFVSGIRTRFETSESPIDYYAIRVLLPDKSEKEIAINKPIDIKQLLKF